MLKDLPARELRVMNPTEARLIEAVDLLIELGWKFKPSSVTPAHIQNPYTYGWWTHPEHPVKCRLVGDPGNFHFKAWDTLVAYIAK